MLAEALRACGVVRRGQFVLASGKSSDWYIDVKAACAKPTVLRTIGRQVADIAAGQRCDRLAGMELGAVPITVATALAAGIPYVIVRKGLQDHGAGRQMEGDLVPGERVLVIEDVTTTGASTLRAVQMLRAAGAIVEKAVVVVDRQEGAVEALAAAGVELMPLVRASELLDEVRNG